MALCKINKIVSNIELKKFATLNNDIIIIDGLWGSGKSLIAPIVGGLRNVEKYRSNPLYEHICVLNKLGEVSDQSCETLLQTYSDMDQYNNLIGREVNLRWGDDSGLSNNPQSLKYIKRLFSGEGDSYIDKINSENIALCLMTANIVLTPDMLNKAFSDRLKFIHIVRHPIYVFQHWYHFLSRFDHPRNFTLAFDDSGYKVPWFWKERSSVYKELDIGEKTIQSIIMIYRQLFDKLDQFQKTGNDCFVISFESIVYDAEKIVTDVSRYLNRDYVVNVKSLLKKQKIPRNTLSSGKGHFVQYGFNPQPHVDDGEEFIQLLDNIDSLVSKSSLNRLLEVVNEYNLRFPSKLNEFSA